MKQSRAMSLLEAIISVIVGFGLSIGCQGIFLPLLGVPIPWAANFYFAIIMTVVSIARQFVLRRVFEALHIRRPLSPAMVAIIEERRRQIEVEGWDACHDEQHEPGEIAQAGASYALAHTDLNGEKCPQPHFWPWAHSWWKPQDFRRDLVRAGALILAELEKYDRNRKPRKKLLAGAGELGMRGISAGLTPGNCRGLTDEEIQNLNIAAMSHREEILGRSKFERFGT